MKLSQLVAFRESLDHLEYLAGSNEIRRQLSVCIDTCNLSPAGLGEHQGKLENTFGLIDLNLLDFDSRVQDIKKFVDNKILESSHEYFMKSYQSWEAIKNEPVDQILHRDLRASDDDIRLLKHRISSYSNWKYPGVFIRPGLSPFFSDIIDLDPLYVVDTDHDLLTPTVSKLTPEYQRRIRRYIIHRDQIPHMPSLPQGQIGFVFAWNFFNYTPIEVMKEYFQEIWQILRPGGSCLFTFNNCSRSVPVVLAEHSFASYTPDWAVRNILSNIGYEIVNQYNADYHLNWLEIRKPGELTSMRGGQSLAMVKRKE
jgi:hypothetical protein